MPRSRSPPRERDRSPEAKRRRSGKDHDDERYSSSRRERDTDRDYDSRRDREREGDRRERSRYDRDYRDRDRDRERERSDRRPRDERERDRSRERERERDRDRDRMDTDRVREPAWRDRRAADSPVHTTPTSHANGHSRADIEMRSPSRAQGGASPATSASPAPVTEEEKQRAKREKLEAWKRAQAAKKAAASGGAVAQAAPAPVASSAAKPSGPSLATSLPAKPAFGIPAATLSRIGLPLKPSLAPSKALPSAVAGMDDTDTSKRKLQKLTLPPVDPLIAPRAGPEDGGAVTENLDVVEDEDDDAMDVDVKPAVNGSTQAEAADDDDEEDPLDAFMKENVKEVKKVDAEDEKRFGTSAAIENNKSEVLNLDDDGPDEEDEGKTENNGPLTSEDILALAAKKAKKKELPVPDHSTIKYEPFNKAFYVPSAETNALDDDDVDLMRMELDGIKIRGQNCPKPVKNWGAFGLPAGCYDVIRRLGYSAPTPIQAQAVPAIMSGRDIIGVAKTGSGKTIAFLLPLFRHIKDQRPLENGEGPMALIMTPTRELATQIWRESRPFLAALNMRAVCAYGGSNLSEQIADFKKGAEVVVCTPGRMIDVLTANSGRVTNLRRVTYLVLDEADRMFDMGFEPQVMKIVNTIRPDRQTLLFSATFPQKMDALARKILNRPLEITVGGRSVVAKEIDQRVEVRTEETKFLRLLEILGEMGEQYKDEDDFRTLIFVDRQESADELFKELMRKGYICTSLHGGKDQVDRDQAIADFKAGFVPIVVATSVAARGLDVKELKLVINYDCPNHMEDYVHRAGRTGRAGNTGICITFITPEQDRYSVDLQRALKASGAYIPPELQTMSDGFLAKVKEGKAKSAGSGFGGKGLDKFDAERESKDRAQRSAYGEEGTGPEKAADKPATAAEVAKQEAAMPKFDFNVQIMSGPAPDKLPSGPRPVIGPGGMLGQDVAQLPPQTLAALQKAEAAGRGVNVKESLAAAVAKIQASLGGRGGGSAGSSTPAKAKDPDATDFHAVVPINDYPQKARWKATNKEQMVQLIELSGASITNKGIFYEPGKEPGPGQEPKLHLLIESNEEFRVKLAVDELRRVLLEASVAALQNEGRPGPTGGRYQV